jgi:hypothetical protein
MTEAKIATLYSCLSAFRAQAARRAGELAEIADRVRPLDEELANAIERHAMDEAAGLETLTRIADDAQDDTLTMSVDDVIG